MSHRIKLEDMIGDKDTLPTLASVQKMVCYRSRTDEKLYKENSAFECDSLVKKEKRQNKLS